MGEYLLVIILQYTVLYCARFAPGAYKREENEMKKIHTATFRAIIATPAITLMATLRDTTITIRRTIKGGG